LGTKGVADVSSYGGFVKQYEIALDPDRLKSFGIGIQDVFAALEKNNQNTGGAYIEKNSSAYFIRSEGLLTNAEDIKNIVVHHTPAGIPVLLSHIGDVRFGAAIRYGAMTKNGVDETVGAVVMMLKGANSSEVIANVKERIAAIEKTLPEGVVIEAFLDRTKLVNNAISTVTKNLAEGALIVIFVLVLLLGNLRAGLVVASVIPLSMLFAVSMMNVLGISGNLMSLGAIDFGLIVDGAVIIVEASLHHLVTRNSVMKLSQSEMDLEVGSSAKSMMSAAAFGQVIILIVYLPILSLVGIEGKMFKPMAETVMLAITGAFILSVTYVPVASSLLLSRRIRHSVTLADTIIRVIQSAYQPTLRWALKHRVAVVAATVVVFTLSLGLFASLGGEFLPELDEGDFAVETRTLPGSSLSETINATLKGERVLLENFPEVEKVIGKIGASEIPTDPMPLEGADMMVIMKDKSQWVSASTKQEMIEKMQQKLEEQVPGIWFGFQHPIQMRFNELMTGARQDVVLKIYGEDLDKLSHYAELVGKQVSRVEGAEDLFVEKITGLPQIVIRYDREKVAYFGLNLEDINSVINSALAGKAAGVVFEGERRFDLTVRYAPDRRENIEDIRNIVLTTPAGQRVPLYQVAGIELEPGPAQIQRDDAKRRIIVGFNVRGRDVESIVHELRDRIAAEIKFEAGYFITYGGSFKNLEEARGRLLLAVPAALALIFIMLFFAFNSIKQSLLIYTAIPLSAIGGIISLWIRDMPFSISAGVGFIALFGVSVLNGIVLIAEFNKLKGSGIADTETRIKQGTKVRLRPVLMTALVASLGFLPMALSQGSGAEVQRPLATVVIGGLVSATFLTLVVLPCLYSLAEQVSNHKK
jgi:cobalt-zinc-cadmium resistance protein CzcA